jgi:hypothetical protein
MENSRISPTRHTTLCCAFPHAPPNTYLETHQILDSFVQGRLTVFPDSGQGRLTVFPDSGQGRLTVFPDSGGFFPLSSTARVTESYGAEIFVSKPRGMERVKFIVRTETWRGWGGGGGGGAATPTLSIIIKMKFLCIPLLPV